MIIKIFNLKLGKIKDEILEKKKSNSKKIQNKKDGINLIKHFFQKKRR